MKNLLFLIAFLPSIAFCGVTIDGNPTVYNPYTDNFDAVGSTQSATDPTFNSITVTGNPMLITAGDNTQMSSGTITNFAVTIPIISTDATNAGMNTAFNSVMVGCNSVIDTYELTFPSACTGSVTISTCAVYPNYGTGTTLYYTNTQSTSAVAGITLTKGGWVRVTANIHTLGARLNACLVGRKLP